MKSTAQSQSGVKKPIVVAADATPEPKLMEVWNQRIRRHENANPGPSASPTQRKMPPRCPQPLASSAATKPVGRKKTIAPMMNSVTEERP